MVRPAHTAQRAHLRRPAPRRASSGSWRRASKTPPPSRSPPTRGVSLRTFYRHFASGHDLLFADYDAGLQWFRGTALLERSPQESILESVQSAIFAFPYDARAVTQIAALQARTRPGAHRPAYPATGGGLRRRHRRTALPGGADSAAGDERLHTIVTARCIAAAVFGAMEMWMVGTDRSLDELTRLCSTVLRSLREGVAAD